MTYLQSCRHHLVLVYTREILILDLEINQTVGIIPAERTGSPFTEVKAKLVVSFQISNNVLDMKRLSVIVISVQITCIRQTIDILILFNLP